jgi:hypothetical protein
VGVKPTHLPPIPPFPRQGGRRTKTHDKGEIRDLPLCTPIEGGQVLGAEAATIPPPVSSPPEEHLRGQCCQLPRR